MRKQWRVPESCHSLTTYFPVVSVGARPMQAIIIVFFNENFSKKQGFFVLTNILHALNNECMHGQCRSYEFYSSVCIIVSWLHAWKMWEQFTKQSRNHFILRTWFWKCNVPAIKPPQIVNWVTLLLGFLPPFNLCLFYPLAFYLLISLWGRMEY